MLKLCLYYQDANKAEYKQVWQCELKGKYADDAYAALYGLSIDPYMQGEMVSLRFKNGNGGGCLVSGSFLDVKFTELGGEGKKADAYFGGGKWRSW